MLKLNPNNCLTAKKPENMFLTGEVSTMTISVALPAGAVAAGQVPGERGGDGTDREERLREQRIAVEEAAKREPAIRPKTI